MTNYQTVSNFLEEKKKDRFVSQSKANDNDVGEAGRIIYYIGNADDEDIAGKFSIDEDTGIITTNDVCLGVDESMVVKVQAHDAGPGVEADPANDEVDEITISVVRGDNKYAPVWSEPDGYTFETDETSGKDQATTLGTVSATDGAGDASECPDVKAAITYKIKSPNDTPFAVDSDGTITLKSAEALDHEEKSLHALILEASDNSKDKDGNSQARITEVKVSITVKNINDNFPVMDMASIRLDVTEGPVASPAASVMNPEEESEKLVISATDEDAGDTLTYAIASVANGTPDPPPFAIDSDDGHITITGELCAATQSVYTIFVKATDAAGNVADKATEIAFTVEETNNHKPILTATKTDQLDDDWAIAEQKEPEEPVHIVTISATDDDCRSDVEITFSLVAGDESGTFDIDEDSGKVTLVKALDYESDDTEYKLVIRASDNAQGVAAKTNDVTVTVKVLDVDDELPIFDVDG